MQRLPTFTQDQFVSAIANEASPSAIVLAKHACTVSTVSVWIPTQLN